MVASDKSVLLGLLVVLTALLVSCSAQYEYTLSDVPFNFERFHESRAVVNVVEHHRRENRLLVDVVNETDETLNFSYFLIFKYVDGNWYGVADASGEFGVSLILTPIEPHETFSTSIDLSRRVGETGLSSGTYKIFAVMGTLGNMAAWDTFTIR